MKIASALMHGIQNTKVYTCTWACDSGGPVCQCCEAVWIRRCSNGIHVAATASMSVIQLVRPPEAPAIHAVAILMASSSFQAHRSSRHQIRNISSGSLPLLL